MGETLELRPSVSARERILESAYDLFSRRGIRGVGIDEVDRARRRRQGHALSPLLFEGRARDRVPRAARGASGRGPRRGRREERGTTPEEPLLAIFDVFDEWFHEDGFDGCSFINVLLEIGDLEHPVGQASVVHLENIRDILRSLAERGRPARPGRVRPLMAHPDEGLDRLGRRGRPQAGERAQEIGCLAEYRDGSVVDEHPPLVPGEGAFVER